MKKVFYFVSVLLFGMILSSCEKTDLSDETGIEFAIDKENVEPPGGQNGKSGSNSEEGYLQKIDKENVEPPGGQGSN